MPLINPSCFIHYVDGPNHHRSADCDNEFSSRRRRSVTAAAAYFLRAYITVTVRNRVICSPYEKKGYEGKSGTFVSSLHQCATVYLCLAHSEGGIEKFPLLCFPSPRESWGKERGEEEIPDDDLWNCSPLSPPRAARTDRRGGGEPAPNCLFFVTPQRKAHLDRAFVRRWIWRVKYCKKRGGQHMSH